MASRGLNFSSKDVLPLNKSVYVLVQLVQEGVPQECTQAKAWKAQDHTVPWGFPNYRADRIKLCIWAWDVDYSSLEVSA